VRGKRSTPQVPSRRSTYAICVFRILSMIQTDKRFSPEDATGAYDAISAKSKHRANMVLKFLRSNLGEVIKA